MTRVHANCPTCQCRPADRTGEVTKAILLVMAAQPASDLAGDAIGDGWTLGQLAAATGIHPSTLRGALTRLAQRGQVQRVARGRYVAARPPDRP